MARIKSHIFVSSLMWRYDALAIPYVISKRGADEGGAIYLELDLLDGTLQIYAPAPVWEGGDERAWMPVFTKERADSARAKAYLDRIRRDDPDAWIICTEDREGRHCLDPVTEV